MNHFNSLNIIKDHNPGFFVAKVNRALTQPGSTMTLIGVPSVSMILGKEGELLTTYMQSLGTPEIPVGARISEYNIIKDSDPNHLMRKVNEECSKGWEVYGTTQMDSVLGARGDLMFVYVQALVKYEV